MSYKKDTRLICAKVAPKEISGNELITLVLLDELFNHHTAYAYTERERERDDFQQLSILYQ